LNIFTVLTKDERTHGRIGRLELPHGTVETPMFMPVGTNGTVKAMHHRSVEDIGYRLILANTYHLYLRPGTDVLESYGGLHRFSSWKHNILTDSGGFQIFSLAGLRTIKEEGVTFRSHIDGSLHHLTPEGVVDIQQIIGSDIMMCLDVCTPPEITHAQARDALEITTRWAKRSKMQWLSGTRKTDGALFGIIQGNFYKDLRRISALEIGELDFPGVAIGGLSVGEQRNVFIEYLGHTAELIDRSKPRYVMGIGTPDYILEAVSQGIDIFDCVLATRTARNGSVFTDDGMIQLKKARHAYDQDPIMEGCPCCACTSYSRGYLRHLFKTHEILGLMLASEHNLTYLYRLMEQVKAHIKGGSFDSFKRAYLQRYRISGGQPVT